MESFVVFFGIECTNSSIETANNQRVFAKGSCQEICMLKFFVWHLDNFEKHLSIWEILLNLIISIKSFEANLPHYQRALRAHSSPSKDAIIFTVSLNNNLVCWVCSAISWSNRIAMFDTVHNQYMRVFNSNWNDQFVPETKCKWLDALLVEDQSLFQFFVDQINQINKALSLLIWLTFSCSKIFAINWLCKARKPYCWERKHNLLTGFGLLNNDFVIQRVNNITCHWVPDQVVMNSAEPIIAVNDVWLHYFTFI